jgi:hypothetical protein
VLPSYAAKLGHIPSRQILNPGDKVSIFAWPHPKRPGANRDAAQSARRRAWPSASFESWQPKQDSLRREKSNAFDDASAYRMAVAEARLSVDEAALFHHASRLSVDETALFHHASRLSVDENGLVSSRLTSISGWNRLVSSRLVSSADGGLNVVNLNVKCAHWKYRNLSMNKSAGWILDDDLGLRWSPLLSLKLKYNHSI